MENDIDTLIKSINIPLGSISIIGCLLILITFIAYKNIRTFILELVFYLALSCLFRTLSIIIYFPNNDLDSTLFICHFQSFFIVLFTNSIYIWTTLISYSIYSSVIYLKDFSNNQKRKRIIYLIIGFGIPLILSVIGTLLELFGKSGYWCSISNNKLKGKIYILLNYSIMWMSTLLNFFFYLKVIKYLKANFTQEEKIIVNRYSNTLISYIIIQIICILPPSINRVYNLITNKSIATLSIFHGIFVLLQGMAYSIVYGLNPSIRESLKNTCLSLCGKKIKERSYSICIEDDNNEYKFDKLSDNFMNESHKDCHNNFYDINS